MKYLATFILGLLSATVTDCDKSTEETRPNQTNAQVQSALTVAKDSYAGLPLSTGYPHQVTVWEYNGFTLGFCKVRKTPVWISYRLGPPRAPSLSI